MESVVLNLSEHEQILVEVLQKAVAVVDTVDVRYREVAFPSVLQALLKVLETAKITQNANGRHVPELQLPSNLSVNEFFRKAMPATHLGRFVCAAYYLFHIGKTEHFAQADVLEIYGKLRQSKPKNFSDVMSECIRKAYIIDAPASSNKQMSWVITQEGEKYVEGLLNVSTSGND